jgi:hypothetical protein
MEKRTPTPENILAYKYLLNEGNQAVLEKVKIKTNSSVPVGSKMQGTLKEDVQVGEPVTFSDTTEQTSTVKKIYVENGILFFETDTSVYKLVREPVDVLKVSKIITSMGSQYSYLPDGRSQRHKKVTGENSEPQNILLFIPSLESLRADPKTSDLSILKHNHDSFVHDLVQYYGRDNDKEINTIDENGVYVEVDEKIRDEVRNHKRKLFLSFQTNGKPDFVLEVGVDPVLGSHTYDTRTFVNPTDGIKYTERHIGNQVTNIILK